MFGIHLRTISGFANKRKHYSLSIYHTFNQNNSMHPIKLLPILPYPDTNAAFADNPLCKESLQMVLEYYPRIGFVPPWIGYFVEKNGELVGNAAFKGAPVGNTVEIAYAVFETHQNQGIGTEICHQLVALARITDPGVKITARTLPEKNFSTRILEKNNFQLRGIVLDPEDGEVWEWVVGMPEAGDTSKMK